MLAPTPDQPQTEKKTEISSCFKIPRPEERNLELIHTCEFKYFEVETIVGYQLEGFGIGPNHLNKNTVIQPTLYVYNYVLFLRYSNRI